MTDKLPEGAELFDSELEAESNVFMRAVVKGLVELEQRREISLAEVKSHLGLNK